MSRIGRMPIELPAGVSIDVAADNTVTVKGAKGQLTEQFNENIKISVDGNTVTVTRPNDEKKIMALHGLTRAKLANMVNGTANEFVKSLDIVGVGYRAAMTGSKLTINIGYSHPVEVEPPAGISFEVPAPTKILVKGIDRQVVGQVAADIRKIRKPEPYKGKGIRYTGEVVRRKEGKTGAK